MIPKIEIKKQFDAYVDQVRLEEVAEQASTHIQRARRQKVAADIMQDITNMADAVCNAVSGNLSAPIVFASVGDPEPIPTSVPDMETYVYTFNFDVFCPERRSSSEDNKDYWVLHVKANIVEDDTYTLVFKRSNGKDYDGDIAAIALAIAVDCWIYFREDYPAWK